MISKVMWPLFSGRLGLAVVMAMMVLGFGGTLAQPTAVAQCPSVLP